MTTTDRSRSFHEHHRAVKTISGGVNSPVRSFKSVGGQPIFIKQGRGAFITDIDDNQYIDFICSWGPLILGHAYPAVVKAVQDACESGLGFGTATVVETDLAERVQQFMPSMELLRMVSSGTEATMSAIRLARGFTHRNKLLKFEGCYHGHSDSLLVKAGSGALTLGVPSSPGVPESLSQHTLNAQFNDLNSVEQLFAAYPDEIAAVIIEPMAGNMNFIPADPIFLQGVRDLCDRYQAVLIFDEVMTGFRITQGGAQHFYNIKPDLTTLGKVIGGGLPVGAFGGKRHIMEHLAPTGSVYQAGTLSGNPVAMTCGLATLTELQTPGLYDQLTRQTKYFTDGVQQLAQRYHIPMVIHQQYSMFGLFFTEQSEITSFQQVTQCNLTQFNQFFNALLDRGVYLAPSAFECGFTSLAHDKAVMNQALNAVEDVMQTLLN